MILERKKNTIRNLIWGMLNRLIAILGPFAVRTIIIYIMGTEYLGLSSLFSSILQVLSMTELGVGSAIAFSMYAPISNNDEERICALLNLFRKVYKIVGVAILTIGLALMPCLPLLINGEAPTDINIYLLYLLYLFNASISYLLSGYKNVLFSAYQREDMLSKIYTVLLLIEYIVQIVILLSFRNYYLYYVIVPIVSVANNIIINYLTKKYYPQLLPKGKVPDNVLIDIKEKVSGVIVSKFCGLTRNTFDSIIISTFLGLTIVAIYSNYYYILSNLASVIVIIATSMKAGIGNSVALDSVEKNFNDYNIFTFIYSWIASWCTICLLCLYQPFMKAWVGEENTFPFYIVALLCIYFNWQTMGDMTNVYSGAVGLWWENRYRTIYEAISNLILNIILGYYWGVFGIVFATVITILLFNFIWQTKILFKEYFKDFNFGNYVLNYVKYNLVTAVVGGLTLLVCSIYSFGVVGDLIYRGFICVILPNLLFLVSYKKSKYFNSAKLLVKNMFMHKH